jgi:hypothetical protein
MVAAIISLILNVSAHRDERRTISPQGTHHTHGPTTHSLLVGKSWSAKNVFLDISGFACACCSFLVIRALRLSLSLSTLQFRFSLSLNRSFLVKKKALKSDQVFGTWMMCEWLPWCVAASG